MNYIVHLQLEPSKQLRQTLRDHRKEVARFRLRPLRYRSVRAILLHTAPATCQTRNR
jgi:hypothetical protein